MCMWGCVCMWGGVDDVVEGHESESCYDGVADMYV